MSATAFKYECGGPKQGQARDYFGEQFRAGSAWAVLLQRKLTASPGAAAGPSASPSST